jgi:peptidoglycan/LPS O-acetylase OafA/YrhL
MPPQYFGGLDFVRAASALAVMWYHFGYMSWAGSTTSRAASLGLASFPELASTSSWGWVGVEVFFVISGFVIAQTAYGKTAIAFGSSRLRRLFPAMAICATITASVALLIGLWPAGEIVSRYIAALTFWPPGPWIDGVYWTLTIEVVFYAAVFCLLALGQAHHIEIFGIALGSASTTYLVAVKYFHAPMVDMHFLLLHGCHFAVGIMFWVVATHGNNPVRAAATTCFILAGLVEISLSGIPASRGIAMAIWLIALVAIAVSAHLKFTGTVLTRRLGLMTYPLYLVHQVVGCAILRVTPWTGRYIALALAISVVLITAWVVVDLEKHVRQTIDQLIKRPRGDLSVAD